MIRKHTIVAGFLAAAPSFSASLCPGSGLRPRRQAGMRRSSMQQGGMMDPGAGSNNA